jgi:DHA2 family multidrug resistance protein
MKLPNATGLVTVCRNLGGAVGLAALNTMRLNYSNMHTQELGAAMDPARPEVQAWLEATEANLRALGEGDPHGMAIMQLTRRLQVESAVMTFNNLFLVMAACFAAMLLLVPLLKRPPIAGQQAPAQDAH